MSQLFKLFSRKQLSCLYCVHRLKFLSKTERSLGFGGRRSEIQPHMQACKNKQVWVLVRVRWCRTKCWVFFLRRNVISCHVGRWSGTTRHFSKMSCLGKMSRNFSFVWFLLYLQMPKASIESTSQKSQKHPESLQNWHLLS